LPLARTTNTTQTGQRTHSVRIARRRVSDARKMPVRSASAAWTLGIAAYGFAANASKPAAWRGGGCPESAFVNPRPEKTRGGAVGTRR
jgi:hypothetical protein